MFVWGFTVHTTGLAWMHSLTGGIYTMAGISVSCHEAFPYLLVLRAKLCWAFTLSL